MNTTKPNANVRPASKNAWGNNLSRRQIRILRGLNRRWMKLKESRSVDQEELEGKRIASQQEFGLLQEKSQFDDAETRRVAITDWDAKLDSQIGRAERETLYTIQHQQQQSRELKTEFIRSKGDQKKQYDDACDGLIGQRETASVAAQGLRESILGKLENQRGGLEQRMYECREWVGIKTGNVALQSLTIPTTTSPAGQAGRSEPEAISNLDQVAKRFEAIRKDHLTEIGRMEGHPLTRFFGSYGLLSVGPILGAIAAWISWGTGLEPLIVGVIGLLSAVILTAVVHYATAPLVSGTIGRLFPNVVEQEQLGYTILLHGKRIAEANCQQELARIQKQYHEKQQRLDEDYRNQRTRLLKDFDDERKTLVNAAREKRVLVARARVESVQRTNSDRKPKFAALEKSQAEHWHSVQVGHHAALAGLEDAFHRSQKSAVERWKDGCEQAAERMRFLRGQVEAIFPAWSSDQFASDGWPRLSDALVWPLGEIQPMAIYSSETSKLALPAMPPEPPWPIFFDLVAHGSLIIESSEESRDLADAMVRNLMLRAITSVPAGNLNITVIDPKELGKPFSWLMALADIDPALVGQRVWTQPLQIAEQLAGIARHVEDMIQRCLRDRYSDLIEYNRNAGPMAVPYRLIVWPNFPSGLDDSSWQSLRSILSSGSRCGVGVILQVSDRYPWPSFADREQLDAHGLHINLVSDQDIRIALPELAGCTLTPMLPPVEDRLQAIMSHHLEAAATVGKLVVPFETIAISEKESQTASSADGLAIPLGISDAGRTQSMRLGAGTAQHILIAGKTGSGKSSLLHTMITSAAVKYGPDQLRLVLLDFKKGVEFQVYAEVSLSHADIIGIESKREFGVSTLEYLDRVMHARGEAFRQWGVQDLSSLAKKVPQHAMPRILVVIDEFQELFVEDDKLSQQASMLLDRIVRQGRSFGVHLVLASQTLGGAYSLPRTTLAQMAVRIALQCDSSDAMLILSEDNDAAVRLRHSGQAIYNEQGGRIEGNQPFQVAYVGKSDQMERLRKLPSVPVPKSPTTNALGRRIVFEGHKPAIWDSASIASATAAMRIEVGAIPMYLGESVSIDPPIIKLLTRNAGRNCMVVGQEERTAAGLLSGTVAGFLENATSDALSVPDACPRVVVLDGSRSEDVSMKKLMLSLSENKTRVRCGDVRSSEETMRFLQVELERRAASSDIPHPPMLICIVNLSRFRELKKNEEFSFGEEVGGQIKPDAILTNLLRDGPPLGMHVWIWSDSAGTLMRWISRPAMRDIELKILMQMSTSDSNQLIDSGVANRLDPHVVLLHDDIEGKVVKFRPFALDSVLDSLRSSPGSHVYDTL